MTDDVESLKNLLVQLSEGEHHLRTFFVACLRGVHVAAASKKFKMCFFSHFVDVVAFHVAHDEAIMSKSI